MLDRYVGASHFADLASFEVQRTNHFELVIEGLNDIDPSVQFEDSVRLVVKSVSGPAISIDPIELKHGNETVKVAAAPSYNDIDVSIYDTIGKDVQGLMQAWFYKIFDPQTHLMGLVKDYKKTASLYLYAPDASVIRVWTLYGVFPTSISCDELNYEDSQTVSVSITLSVDKAVENRIQ